MTQLSTSGLLWWDSWDSVSLNASFIMAISLRICFLVSLRFLTLPSISSRLSSLLLTMLDGLDLVLVLPSGLEWDLINWGGGARVSPLSPDLCLCIGYFLSDILVYSSINPKYKIALYHILIHVFCNRSYSLLSSRLAPTVNLEALPFTYSLCCCG